MSTRETKTLNQSIKRVSTSVSMLPKIAVGMKLLQEKKAEFSIMSVSQMYELAAIEFLKKHGITKLD